MVEAIIALALSAVPTPMVAPPDEAIITVVTYNKTECIRQGWVKTPTLNLSYKNGDCRIRGNEIHCVDITDGGLHVSCTKEKQCEIRNLSSPSKILASYGKPFVPKVISVEDS